MENLIKELQALDFTDNKYSQFGEEIVLKRIFDEIGTTNKYFVEYGSGDGYSLSNTRAFKDSGWDGLMIDADNKGNNDVKKHFITPVNILSILKSEGCPNQFDLLSSDMDSCDFLVLKVLLQHYNPRVIIAEFNPTLPPDMSVYLDYEPGYFWDGTNKYGFSFEAGVKLMKENGYSLVHNQAQTNLIFISDHVLGGYNDFGISYKQSLVHPINNSAKWINY